MAKGRTGGGTRLKLVEAASYARPIVSTRIGAEGLDFTDRREALLRDDQLCLYLGTHVRATMVAADDVQKVEAQIVQMLRGLNDPRPSSSHG